VDAGSASASLDWAPWRSRPKSAGLITDYDGTLAPIVDDPLLARPIPGVTTVLAKLAERLALVAVVSGRPLAYLSCQLSAVPGLVVVGLYGLEREHDGRPQPPPLTPGWQALVAAAADAAEREAPEGVEVERKGFSVVLHARKQPRAFAWAKEWAAVRAGASGLVARAGRMSVELLPPFRMDKGQVVEELAAGLEAVCFVGDDAGDLPAFAALGRMRARGKHTVAVGVASPEQPDEMERAVDVMVEGPEGAVALIQQLLA